MINTSGLLWSVTTSRPAASNTHDVVRPSGSVWDNCRPAASFEPLIAA
ncbi:hypothetical protein [Arthrobacter alpinus]|nr:hypothetical protein [Arthrobacter alpinus]